MTLHRALAILRGEFKGGDLFAARDVARAHGIDPVKVEGVERVFGAHHPVAEGTKRILGVRR